MPDIKVGVIAYSKKDKGLKDNLLRQKLLEKSQTKSGNALNVQFRGSNLIIEDSSSLDSQFISILPIYTRRHDKLIMCSSQFRSKDDINFESLDVPKDLKEDLMSKTVEPIFHSNSDDITPILEACLQQ